MVTVKRIAGGVFSNWVGDELKAGDTLDVMTPHGSLHDRVRSERQSAAMSASPAGPGSRRSFR